MLFENGGLGGSTSSSHPLGSKKAREVDGLMPVGLVVGSNRRIGLLLVETKYL